MKTLKRILTFCFLMVLVINVACVPAMANDSNLGAAQVLSGMGIVQGYENGEFKLENNITRMEFSALVIRLMGLDDAANAYKDQIFTDVTPDLWGAGYIYLAHSLSIVNGMGNGTFQPQSDVTMNQAIKMVVCALGYGVAAESQGGYPNGYISQAMKLELLDGLSVGERPATRGEVFKMLYNALDAKILEEQFGGDGGFAVSGSTFLDVHDVGVGNGVVTAIPGKDITGNNVELESDEIVISDTVYKTSMNNVHLFFGKNVNYFYDYSDKDNVTVIYMEERGSEKSLTVNAKDIADGTTLNKLSYYENGRLRSVNLSANLLINYNGKNLASADITADVLKPSQGSVTLYDLDSDGKYESAMVMSYENLVVTGLGTDVIYGKYAKRLDIGKYEDPDSVSIIKNGRQIQFSGIKVGDTISFAKSLDGKFIDIIVSDDSVEGTVDSYHYDTVSYYTVKTENGEVELANSEEFEAILLSGHSDAVEPRLGGKYVFLLDSWGDISDVIVISEATDELQYGYVVETASYGRTFEIKLLDAYNTMQIYETASNEIKFGRMVNGNYVVSKESFREIQDFFTWTDYATTVDIRLVKYLLDNEGKLKELYALDSTGSSDSPLDMKHSVYTYTYYNNTFIDTEKKHYVVDSDTVVFYTPNNAKYPEDFVSSTAPERFSNGKTYRSYIYDVKDRHIGAIVVNNDESRYVTKENGYSVYLDMVNSPVMLVTDTYFAEDEDGFTSRIVEGYVSGKLTSVPMGEALMDNSDNPSLIKPGCIIQYEVNHEERAKAETKDEKEEIRVFKLLINGNDKEQSYFDLFNRRDIPLTNSAIRTTYGEIVKIDTNQIIVSYVRAGEVQQDLFVYHANTTVWNCTEEDKLEVLTLNDLQVGQKVFIRQRYNNTREIAIID